MIDRILAFSIHHRWLVVVAALAVAALGAWNFTRLPIDAVPDITNVQVQINTAAPGSRRSRSSSASPSRSRPRWPACRSSSTRARCRATASRRSPSCSRTAPTSTSRASSSTSASSRRRTSCRRACETAMGPIATGLGEIFMCDRRGQARRAASRTASPTRRPTCARSRTGSSSRSCAPCRASTEVNTIGGYEQQFHVSPDPARLVAYGLTFRDVIDGARGATTPTSARATSSATASSTWSARPGQVADDRTTSATSSSASRDGVPIRIARRRRGAAIGRELRTGAATRERRGGRARHRHHADRREQPRRSRSASAAQLDGDQRRRCPRASTARTVYDRTTLVDATIADRREEPARRRAAGRSSCCSCCSATSAPRSSPRCVIPLSMLFTVTGMVESRISANLMSLGAHRLRPHRRRRGDHRRELPAPARPRSSIGSGALLTRDERFDDGPATARSEVVRPSLFGALIIAIVYLPILTLDRHRGKMFRPMALTVLLALAGAMILSMTFVPAAVALLVSGTRRRRRRTCFMRGAQRGSTCRCSACADRHRAWSWSALAALLVVVSGVAAIAHGQRVRPTLDEGDIALHALRIPGTSLTQAVADADGAREARSRQFPEVERGLRQDRHGRGRDRSDAAERRRQLHHAEAARRVAGPATTQGRAGRGDREARSRDVPGNNYEFTQPIQMRFNELISGVRSDVAVKIFGDDLDSCCRVAAKRSQSVLQDVPGAADVKVEQVTGLPMLTDRRPIAPRWRATASTSPTCRRSSRSPSAARRPAWCSRATGASTSSCACPSICASTSTRSSACRSRCPCRPATRAVAQTGIGTAAPLRAARRPSPTIEIGAGAQPDQPRERQAPRRRHGQRARPRPRLFVAEAQREVDAEVKLPAGYWIDWGGQFEQLIAARSGWRSSCRSRCC